jgi:hypothetical protein
MVTSGVEKTTVQRQTQRYYQYAALGAAVSATGPAARSAEAAAGVLPPVVGFDAKVSITPIAGLASKPL